MNYRTGVLAACLAAALAVRASAGEPPEVSPLDPAAVDPATFSEEEVYWAPMLVHLSTVANAVVMEGAHRGFIDVVVWRRPQDNRPYNARVLENHLSLAFFYTAERPWNPYRGDRALRARLEAVLDFWCRSQHEDGRFAEYGPENWSLAPTAFGIKFMGETLRRLHESEAAGGPTIDAALRRRTEAAARRAIEALLTREDLIAHGRRFSNQYTGFWGGALAYLEAHPDQDLRRRLIERVREVAPGLSSPAGYHYENNGCDWRYVLGTHRNNVRQVWNYARGSELGELIVAMERPWVEWLAYNAVCEPDGSFFTLNRAIETRTGAGGFATWEFPVAEEIPLARAFAPTLAEHRASLAAHRRRLIESWPEVGPLESYSPHAFADRLDRHEWRPTQPERDAGIAELPYLARDRFAHQRADDRNPMHSTFVRRPDYYVAFNAGAKVAAMQRYGLGLLWSPQIGSVLQTQSRGAAHWGTQPAGGDVYEAGAFHPTVTVGGATAEIKPGARDLPGGETEAVVFEYPLGEAGRKSVTFADDHVAVEVAHAEPFTEHLPLLLRQGDELTVDEGLVRLRRGEGALVIALSAGVEVAIDETDVRHGPFRLVRLRLESAGNLEYRLSFE